MNVLTHSRALVNSLDSNLHRYNSSPATSFLRQFSGESPSKTRTLTHKHTLNQSAVRSKLRRRSTTATYNRYSTAMDSDPNPHPQTPEFDAGSSSFDDRSVVADENGVGAMESDSNSLAPEFDVTETPVKTSGDGAGAGSLSFDDRSVVADEEYREANANEAGGEGRRELPEEMLRNVVTLSCESSAEGGNCDVYLVGTAHVSVESCQEVEAVISFLKPQVVFLELCSNRVAVLTPQNIKVPTMGEMVESWKKNHNTFGIIYSWFLAKVASRLEVFPGSEFRVAYEEAIKYGGKVVLGDRPVNITLRRTWSKMPLWHKTKLIYAFMFQSIFLPSPARLNEMLKELDDVDMLTLVIQEMSKEFPTLMETLVHERDKYMSSSLLKVAREHSSVVAVVGKGHLQGIKNYWKQPVELRELMELPSKKAAVSVSKVLSTVGVAVAGVAIISGIYLSIRK